MDNPIDMNGYKIVMVHPVELPQVAQLIIPGLSEIQRQAHKRGFDYEYYNILREIEVNLVTLSVVFKEEQYVGFLITRSIFRGLPNKHYLQIVALFIDKPYRSQEWSAYDTMVGYSHALAKELKCSGMWHETFREGHRKPLEKFGYEVKQFVLVHEFGPGG